MEGTMKNKINFIFLISGLMLSACAAQSGWTPAIDTYGDKNVANIQQDKIKCAELAKDSSSDTGEDVGKGALIGGALGAAAGAAIGAAAGNAGKGAAIGAAVGGIGGGGIMGWNTSESYKEIFRSCMKNRGHTVLN
jgi:outer membrane lipoprotein SlyB